MSDLDFYCGRMDGRMDGRTNEAIPWSSCEPRKNISRISNWSNVKDDDYLYWIDDIHELPQEQFMKNYTLIMI